MNDRHPAGDSFPADHGAEYSHAGYDTAHYEQSAYGSYGTTGYATASGDGGWPTGAYDVSTTAGYQVAYETGVHDTGTYGTTGYDTTGYDTGGYDTGGWDATGYQTTGYETTGYGATGYDSGAYDGHAYGVDAYATGSYDTTGWDGHVAADTHTSGLIPQQPGPHVAEQDWATPADGTAQWNTTAYEPAGWDGTGAGYEPEHGYDAGGYETAAYSAYSPDAYVAQPFEADAYAVPDAYAAGTDDVPGFDARPAAAYDEYEATDGHEPHGGASQAEGSAGGYEPQDAYETHEPVGAKAFGAEPGEAVAHEEPVLTLDSEAEPDPGAATLGPQNRGRRRSPKPRRSALLTVAAPSVAVLGVAGIAAASVLPSTGEEETAQAAPDTTEVKASPANTKLDTQLAGLREAGDDFADRASRTQERIDLKKRQEAERRRAAAEAARREALRPKFALPVQGVGISAYFGQAGINWMSTHTGIDFPVSYGTPVKASTDGTLRTQWSYAYGNMLILTAPDGTETWYCHLSSYQFQSGSVKAGTVIAYSGNSGNSTGPHLHLEVRPGGGSPIDPLPWFRSHGLEPT